MLLSTFGTPSALMYGGLNIVRNLVEVGIGPHKLAYANTTADLRKVLAEIGSAPDVQVILSSDFPEAELCALFIRTRAPIVLFIDGFDDVVNYVSKTHEMSLANSLRLSSRSICALEPLVQESAVLRFDSRAYNLPLKDIVLTIGAFFELALPEAKVDQIVSILAGKHGGQSTLSDYLFNTFPHATPPGHAIRRLTVEDRQLVSQLTSAYSTIAAGQALEKMAWPISLFLNREYPVAPFPGRVELVGPARFIAYGPYLHLTVGQWQATIVFEIAQNYSGNALCADAFSGDVLSVVTAQLPIQGTYKFQLNFEISDSAKPVELRFQILSGAIEGILTLNSVSMQRGSQAAISGGSSHAA